jgi:hypothetical protein
MIDPSQLNDIAQLLDQAAERGAKRALESIGLHDEDAGKDIHDLRSLLDGWRGTKRTIGNIALQYLTVGLLTFISTVIYFKSATK